MPTNRTYDRAEPVQLGGAELLHIFLGDCLLGGGCRICDQEEERGSPRILRVAFVRELWRTRREEFTAQWLAVLEQRGEPGRYFPWYAEVLFDGAAFPPSCNPAWPEAVRSRHLFIGSSLTETALWYRGD